MITVWYAGLKVDCTVRLVQSKIFEGILADTEFRTIGSRISLSWTLRTYVCHLLEPRSRKVANFLFSENFGKLRKGMSLLVVETINYLRSALFKTSTSFSLHARQ
jgi:hypothetical protein